MLLGSAKLLGLAQCLAAKILLDAQLIGQVWVPCALHLVVTTVSVALQWISGRSPQRRKLHGVRSVERNGEQSVNVFLEFRRIVIEFLARAACHVQGLAEGVRCDAVVAAVK
jgi:hypothetical protein